MNTLKRIRDEQQARYAKEHEANMAKYPWIREAINAYADADEAQIATVEAIVAKRWGK
jgi:hypothetical protein